MCKRVLLVVFGCIAVGMWGPRVTGGAEVIEPSRRAKPCYVVIAVDVSGSMEKVDTPTEDSRGRRWTLRDEGQLTLLQLLPFVYSDLYVGVCHFSDRVRYALPSEETGVVLPWGGNYLSEAACRNLVRPAEFMSSFQTDIVEGLDWALARIEAARRQYGDGPGKILLLSQGDPRDSSRELSGGGPLLSAGARLAEQNVGVYPIIINEASYRPGGKRGSLSSAERTAERVMVSLAGVTGGRAYRIAPEMGFPDILMDVFGLGRPVVDEARISPYDWAVVVVGPTPEAVNITPVAEGQAARPTTWRVDDALENRSTIRGHAVASQQWPATILRRPEGSDAVGKLWNGRWRLRPADGGLEAAVRVYRVPDFLLQLEAEPAFPWWIHQKGQLNVRLFDRHGRGGISRDGTGLSVHIEAQTLDEAGAFAAEQGQWTVPAELYATEAFTVSTAGSYHLMCQLQYRSDDVDVPLLGVGQDVQVHPACVGIDILGTDGRVLGTLPSESEPLMLDIAGGRSVSFRAVPRGVFNAQPTAGTLHLEPLTQPNWTLRAGEDDRPATGRIDLPEGEERLSGWIDLQVVTPLGDRGFRLPDFEVGYQSAPRRIDCAFTDVGRPLWVGELYRQLLTVSAFPIFERFRDETRALFPDTFTEARMRTVELQSGMTQVTSPRGRLVETPKPSGAKGRTLTATYSLESGIPIPQADQCEISVEGMIENLQDAVKTYTVVDPVGEGLFTWAVYHEPRPARAEAVAQVLYSGEPTRFSARWQADQNISAVRFEIPRPEPNGPFFVDLPVAPGAERGSIERPMPSLDSGQICPIYVHVTRRPVSDGPAVEIKLHAGQFRAEDRRLAIDELLVGTEAARDIACHACEPVEIPLRVVFNGYRPGNAQQSALIERFKRSCALTVTSSKGQVREVTETIEWTALAAEAAPAGQATRCTLEGHALYTPEHTGRAAIELKAAFPKDGPASDQVTQQAYGHLAVRHPRLTITVQRVTPGGGEVPVFNSQAWTEGSGELFPATAGFSTQLRIRLRATEQVEAPPSGTWAIALRVLYRTGVQGQWIIESSEDLQLARRENLPHEVQISEDGEYALEVVGRDAASGQVLMRLTTPVVMKIQQQHVATVLAPSAWITPRMQRWPFEYRVTLHHEPGELAQAPLAVQFQLPGADPNNWPEASVQITESDTSQSREVLVTSPSSLPSLEGLRDGAVRFRLSSLGSELLTWEYPNVRVLAPVLERLALGRLSRGREIEPLDGTITWNGSTGLWARPVFRAAPELAGQWIRQKTLVYLWPDGGETLSGGQVPLPLLQAAEGRATVAEFGGQIFTLAADEQDQPVEVLPKRQRWRFWGWPQPAENRRYGLVASAIYQTQDAAGTGADGAMASTANRDRTVAEWTAVYSVDLVLPRVIPWCWFFLAAVVLYLVLVAFLRLFARRPDKLGLDMRLQEQIAVVDPVAFDSLVGIDLRPTPLGKEIELQRRYCTSRWEATSPVLGKLLRPVTTVLTPIRVLLRRALLPRRRAWALITPKTGGNAQGVRQGLLCVWTAPFARTGRGWSSEIGAVDLPAEGQVKSIILDLPYRMEGVTRKMRVSVKIRKAGTDPAVNSPCDTDSELLI